MSIKPPVAPLEQHVERRHGQEVSDPYHWMRERSDPRVLDYLKQENEYTAATMRHTEELQQKLYEEMLSRIKETDSSVPEKLGDYYYYSRMEKGKEYRIHARKRGNLDALEEILLDENLLAEGQSYFKLGTYTVSPDQRLLAYSQDTDGSESFVLLIKNLASGELLDDPIPATYYSVEWANDNRTLFYKTLDDKHRPHQLWRHVLGSAPSEDKVLYTEQDDAFFLDIFKTRSRRFLLLELESNTTSEVWYLDADDPLGSFTCFQRRKQRVEYALEHHGELFYILTNEEAINFKLMSAPIADPARRNHAEVIPYRPEIKLEAVEPFRNHLVLIERAEGTRRIKVYELPGLQVHTIKQPEDVCAIGVTRNPEFETETFRYVYSSPVTPRSVFDYDMVSRTRELKKEEPVLGGYDRTAYETERVFAEAADGTRVPLSLVYRKGLSRDGRNPLLLTGYGAYGACVDPHFDSTLLSLLDRGFVKAIAHVRGGGELGRPWYEDGKLLAKRNSFTDFVACAERLIADNYTSNDRLVIRGGSAGGLLVGAVANMRPQLFKAVVAKVPFVDLMNTMFDPSIPLTVIEWEEWGDPNKREYYEYMLSYSPYDNVAAIDYPEFLITAGLNDPRVAYWEPAKWTAKLRAAKSDDNLLLLKTEMGAGHSGPSGRYEYLRELAFEYAFILDRLELVGRIG